MVVVSASFPGVARGSLGNRARCTGLLGIQDNGSSSFVEVVAATCHGHPSGSSNDCSPMLVLDVTQDNGPASGVLPWFL